MEKVTEERLVKAGWDEKRTIDISNIKDVYQKLGLSCDECRKIFDGIR